MNYKTQARLIYGGLLIVILIFVRIVAGWYGVFDRHSPDRALAAEIERDIGHDVLNIEYSSDIIEGEEILLVYVLTNKPVTEEEVLDWVSSRAPAVFYFYIEQLLNSGDDGSIQSVLFGVGLMLCFSSEECGWRDTGEFVSDIGGQDWGFGYEKGSQLWVKSDKNILVILEKIFKPEASASEQSIEGTDRE